MFFYASHSSATNICIILTWQDWSCTRIISKLICITRIFFKRTYQTTNLPSVEEHIDRIRSRVKTHVLVSVWLLLIQPIINWNISGSYRFYIQIAPVYDKLSEGQNYFIKIAINHIRWHWAEPKFLLISTMKFYI